MKSFPAALLFVFIVTILVSTPIAAEPNVVPMSAYKAVVFQNGPDYSSGNVFGVQEETGVTVATTTYSNKLPIDFYYPPDMLFAEPRPAVLIVNGAQSDVKNRAEIGRPYMRTNQALGWAQLISEQGLVAVTYETGSSTAESLVSVVEWLQQNGSAYGVDSGRFGVWACSNSCISAIKMMRTGNSDFAGKRPIFEVLLYGDMMAYSDIDTTIPLFVVKAVKDAWADGNMIDRFVEKLRAQGAAVEYQIHPGDHAFDCRGVECPPETTAIIQASLEFMVVHSQ